MMSLSNNLRRTYMKRKKKQRQIELAEQRHLMHQSTQTETAVRPDLPAVEIMTATKTRVMPKADVKITIHYVDSLGRQLLPPVTVSGQYKAQLDIPWQTIPSYVLASIHHFQKIFMPNPNGIYLIYAKQMAAPIVVYHRDTNGQLISPPEFLRGNLNSDYDAQPLLNMHQFVQDVHPKAQGTFSKTAEQIQITYETMQLSPLTLQTDTYVELLAQTRVYSEPDTAHLLAKPLPNQSTWRVYQALKEKTNGRVWLNLGGSIWIIAHNLNVVDHYQPQALPEPTALKLNYQVIYSDETCQNAVVNMPQNQPVTAWDEPYGQPMKSDLHQGEVILVTQMIQLDNNSLWAQLADGQYVEAKYLTFINA